MISQFLITASLLVLTFSGSTTVLNPYFTLVGSSQHWEGESLFSLFERGPQKEPAPPQSYPDNGYEFGQNLTYTGPPTHLKWYRLEPLFPASIPFRRGSCTIDSGGPLVGGPLTVIEPGRHLTHGTCFLGPITDRLDPRHLGLHLVVSWEDDQGVHTETIPMAYRPELTDRIGPH
jgi:hypothetical protein